VDAPPNVVFDLLADPRKHHLIDGSGSVRGVARGPQRLSPGALFRVHMRVGVPYQVTNEVVEFEEARRIAWRHFGHHIWRYELEALDDDTRTRIIETFDWSHARSPRLLERMHIPERNARSIEETLTRLNDRFNATHGSARSA
jgi:uncharacterized protein YndB with AHSA1/START domain